MAERTRTVLLALLVAGAGLLGFRHGARAVDAAAETDLIATSGQIAPPPHAEADLLPLDDPATTELLHALPRLHEAAGRGRADAAFAIYRVSERCMRHPLDGDAGLAATSEGGRELRRPRGESAAHAERAALHELCARAVRLDEAGHFGFLSQAVRGGHVPAIRAALGGPRPLGTFGTDRHAEIVRNAEHIAGIHRAVRAAVEHALAAGDREVLFHYAIALRGDGLLRADPDAAYAHLFAASLVPHGSHGPAFYAAQLDDISQHWSAERLSAARREGERLARTFGWRP